jgi:hypothetical protein
MEWWVVAVAPALVDKVLAAVGLLDLARWPREVRLRAGLNSPLLVLATVVVVGAGFAYWIVERPRLVRSDRAICDAVVP